MLEDTPNLTTSPGHGTIISLSAARTYSINSLTLSRCLNESDCYMLNSAQCNLSAVLKHSLHGAGMYFKTYIIQVYINYTHVNNKEVQLSAMEGGFLAVQFIKE